ncbi:MAG: hypothetical protein M0P70_16830 [Desulfobulbaceae bacterium]|nr:hypothetical protein [Desulfobulbaceae bacterium]
MKKNVWTSSCTHASRPEARPPVENFQHMRQIPDLGWFLPGFFTVESAGAAIDIPGIARAALQQGRLDGDIGMLILLDPVRQMRHGPSAASAPLGLFAEGPFLR